MFKFQSDFAKSQFDVAVADFSKLTETVVKLAGEVAEPIEPRCADRRQGRQERRCQVSWQRTERMSGRGATSARFRLLLRRSRAHRRSHLSFCPVAPYIGRQLHIARFPSA